MLRPVAYRPDIDGLRAIAVLSVVVFHTSPHLLPGGFSGVDVFFVISGFLITSVILSNLEDRSFSLLDFYARRIRRILPALLVVMIAVLAGGWFILFAIEYRELGKEVAAGAGFVSNIVYMGESGYFDTDSRAKILLHLWSLGIEEQFYIVWPGLMMLAWRRRWAVPVVIAAALAFSFAANIALIGSAPTDAFYSPLTRAWELMIGCGLAYAAQQGWCWRAGQAHLAAVAGGALVVAGFVLLNDVRPYPGWWGVLPTFGAVLLVSAGPQAWVNRAVLSNRGLVAIGLISYPLYLWHWPLLVFGHVAEVGTSTREIRIVEITLSFAAAVATYFLVERPVRRGGQRGVKAVALLVVTLSVGLIGYICYWQKGFADIGSHDAQREAFVDYFDDARPAWRFTMRTDLRAKFRDECSFYDIDSYRRWRESLVPKQGIAQSCTERDPEKSHVVMIWGDSHAQHLYWGLRENLPADWQILQVASSGCLPDPGVDGPSASDYCRQSNWTALQTVAKAKPDVVVVAQGTGQAVDRFETIADKLEQLGAGRVLVAGPTPHWATGLPEIVARKLWPDTPRRTLVGVNWQMVEVNDTLKRGFKSSARLVFVDIQSVFCAADGCLVYLGEDRQAGLTSMDDGHLLPIASDYLAKQLLVPMILNSTGK